MTTILCVDDDPYLTDLLCYGFGRAGITVVTAHTGRDGLRQLRQGRTAPIDLVLLDVTIPDMDGFTVLTALRAVSSVPVIMLTARHLEQDVLTGLEHGADDYVPKPFSMQVLVTRVQAVLRRAEARRAPVVRTDARVYEIAGAVLESDTNDVVGPDGTRVRLTPTESRIVQLLVEHEGQVLSAERIMERLWDYSSESSVNVIKTHIRHVREKLVHLPGSPQPIRTHPGAGYVLLARRRT